MKRLIRAANESRGPHKPQAIAQKRSNSRAQTPHPTKVGGPPVGGGHLVRYLTMKGSATLDSLAVPPRLDLQVFLDCRESRARGSRLRAPVPCGKYLALASVALPFGGR